MSCNIKPQMPDFKNLAVDLKSRKKESEELVTKWMTSFLEILKEFNRDIQASTDNKIYLKIFESKTVDKYIKTSLASLKLKKEEEKKLFIVSIMDSYFEKEDLKKYFCIDMVYNHPSEHASLLITDEFNKEEFRDALNCSLSRKHIKDFILNVMIK